MKRKIFASLFLSLAFFSFHNYEYFLPSGFPKPYIPKNNQLTDARIELGKKLFFDPILSRDSTISCSSCHQPQFAFTDRKKQATGIKGSKVSRNTPTLTNVAYNTSFLLDGVNPSLENQAIVPFHEKNEFDLHILIASDRLSSIDEYCILSEKAYGQKPSPYVITSSLAAFQRTLISGNSKYDKFINQKNKTIFSNFEKEGKKLFFEKLYCSECHSGFNFTNGALVNNGLYTTYKDSGRIRLTHLESDRAIFKVPTLRNIGVTYPYMHDGSFETLEEVIIHYMNGGKEHENKSNIIKPFKISQLEIKQLVAFLNTLTDSTFINNY